jgi:starch-binding outer membrane protein, SusD/RagB family
MIMKFKSIIYCVLFSSGLLASCNPLDFAPTDEFTEANYWTSEAKAMMVLNTAYSQMFDSYYFFANEALSDNIYEGRGATYEKIISSGQADASNERFSVEWGACYSGIKTCNVFLENIDKVPDMDGTLKTRMEAETRFIRAFLYFRLSTWFGDVPLIDHSITVTEAKTISRTPKDEVMAFVRSELEAITESLPKKEDYDEEDNGRISKGAAIALLARTYLYDNDWKNTVSECDKIINTTSYGGYSLFTSYMDLFLPENEYNNEVILDLEYVPLLRTWSNFYDYAPLSVGARLNSYAPTQELVDSYLMINGDSIDDAVSGYNEDNPYINRDPRLNAIVYHLYNWEMADGTYRTIYTKPGTAPDNNSAEDEYSGQGTNATSTGYYMRKYYDPTSTTSFKSGLNLILIRYADILLMYAEAKNELGEMDENVWDNTIRLIRQRAGFTDSNALDFNASWSKSELRSIIRRERRCELALEGLRIFDIRRWKSAKTVLNCYPHGARFGETGIDNGYIRLDKRTFNPDRDYLWAIPQSQRDIDENLTQNPNY